MNELSEKNKKQTMYVLAVLILAVIIFLMIIFRGPSMKLQPEEKIFFEKGGNTESYDKQIFQK